MKYVIGTIVIHVSGYSGRYSGVIKEWDKEEEKFKI